MLIQEQKQREIRSTCHFLADSASLAVDTYKPQQLNRGIMDRGETRNDDFQNKYERIEGKKSSLSSLFCNYCKRPGHTICNAWPEGGGRVTAVDSRLRTPTRLSKLLNLN